MLTPSGGSLTMVISSFCSLRCKNKDFRCRREHFPLQIPKIVETKSQLFLPPHLPPGIVRGRLDIAAAALPLGEGHLAEHALQLARRHLGGFTLIPSGRNQGRKHSRSTVSVLVCLKNSLRCRRRPFPLPISLFLLGRKLLSLALSSVLSSLPEGRKEGCRSEWLAAAVCVGHRGGRVEAVCGRARAGASSAQ